MRFIGNEKLADYAELTKPRLTTLVLVTTWLGFSLGAKAHPPKWLWLSVLLGTWLAACGAAALNQYIERELDAKMRRTQNRPLPQKRLLPRHALIFGMVLATVGVLDLLLFVNALASLLACLTLFSYLLVYTPLKTRTNCCTLIGAVPGAIPPMIGWAAARGSLGPQAWVLFAILFLWQLPHFLAIAWMYRDDYARAGCSMLPVVDPEGGSTARMIILYCAILIPVTLMPSRMGWAGFSYFWGALVLGMVFLFFGSCTAFFRTPAYAKRLLLASVIYLPALLTWMVLDGI